MPMYEYGCDKCNKTEVVMSRIDDRKDTIPCNECGTDMPRLISKSSFVCYNGPHVLSTRPDKPFTSKYELKEHMKRNNLESVE